MLVRRRLLRGSFFERIVAWNEVPMTQVCAFDTAAQQQSEMSVENSQLRRNRAEAAV